MFVAEEKHNCAWIIQLIHSVEVRDFCQVHKIDNCKVFELVCSCGQNLQATSPRSTHCCKNILEALELLGHAEQEHTSSTQSYLIHLHACLVPVMAKPDYDNTVFLLQYKDFVSAMQNDPQ